MHSYNQHKQKIKHNKIQLEQELWPPAYMNNGKLPHIGYELKWFKIEQKFQKNKWHVSGTKTKVHKWNSGYADTRMSQQCVWTLITASLINKVEYTATVMKCNSKVTNICYDIMLGHVNQEHKYRKL